MKEGEVDFNLTPEQNVKMEEVKKEGKKYFEKLKKEEPEEYEKMKKTYQNLPIIKTDVEKQPFSNEEIKEVLNDSYESIVKVLKKYVDLREDYYSLCAVWIIGTYLHDSFNTYPYLFINAMRGAGKTKLLNLITSLSKNGEVLASPTEAVLFRYPKGNTLGIDEFEGITRKGREGVREMLNACYKKGTKVRRIKQVKSKEGTEQVVEEFEPYKPICMANIYGSEEVLADRCITMILEKSERKDVLRYIEDFKENPQIKSIKFNLNQVLVQLVMYVDVGGYIERWNNHVNYTYTKTTYTTPTTQPTPSQREFMEKIDVVNVVGRELELFFPLLLISNRLDLGVFEKLLHLSESLSKEKMKEQMVESKDVSLYDYISRQNIELGYRRVKDLLIGFRNFLGNVEDYEDRWVNERWIGRALTRLNLYTDKRRLSAGVEVVLDITKAKQKFGELSGVPEKEDEKI